MYHSFYLLKKELIRKNLYSDYKCLFVKSKFFIGSNIIQKVFNKQQYKYLMHKIESLDDTYPTKQISSKLEKFFYNYRYLWRMDLVKDNKFIAAGFRQDVSTIQEWMKCLCFFLVKRGLLKKYPDMFVINKYTISHKGGLGLHLDHNFVNIISSICLGNDARIDFRNGVLGDWGFNRGLFCITLPKNSIFQMKCNSFITNNVKHMIKYTDLVIPRYVIILRNIDPRFIIESEFLQKYRNQCSKKLCENNIANEKIKSFDLHMKYCKKHKLKLKNFHNFK